MFLENLVRAGVGQHYHGQTATGLSDSFDEELSLLQALLLRQLDLELMPSQGVIIEPLGIFDQSADGTCQLSDLACGAQSQLAVRLHISFTPAGQSWDLRVAAVEVEPSSPMLLCTVCRHRSKLLLKPCLPMK